jgi:hypothetical protein
MFYFCSVFYSIRCMNCVCYNIMQTSGLIICFCSSEGST